MQLEQDFFQSLPADVKQLVSQRTEGLALAQVQPDRSVLPTLQKLAETSEWNTRLNQDRNLALSAISGIWLWFGFLDKAHQICQDIPTAEGSYWHGITHRIEADYWNAKYWMRRVGKHEVHSLIWPTAESICGADRQLLDAKPIKSVVFRKSNWDPEGFVDACESANENQDKYITACQILGTAEWKCLLEYCLSGVNAT